MNEDKTRYPLSWPIGRPRAKYRERASFSSDRKPLTVAGALDRLERELSLLGARGVIVSTNVQLRSTDGLPRSGQAEPRDPGAAVYFDLVQAGHRVAHCLATDRWDRVADNIAAIAKHVEATRGQLRWGVGDVLAAFAGHRALPAAGAVQPWWEILGFQERPRDLPTVRARWLELAERHHPDRGGNVNQAAEINAAFDAAERELGQ